jgi:hypothetical protein
VLQIADRALTTIEQDAFISGIVAVDFFLAFVGGTYYVTIFIELIFSWIYVEDYSMLKISEMLDPNLNQMKLTHTLMSRITREANMDYSWRTENGSCWTKVHNQFIPMGLFKANISPIEEADWLASGRGKFRSVTNSTEISENQEKQTGHPPCK